MCKIKRSRSQTIFRPLGGGGEGEDLRNFQYLHNCFTKFFLCQNLFGQQDKKHYLKFHEIYGKPRSDIVKDCPMTQIEIQQQLKPSFKSLSSKCRDFVECVECTKKRIICGEKKLKKDDQHIWNDLLDDIDFSCGDKLLIPRVKKYDILAKNKICVDRRKTCSHPLENAFYNKFPPACSACCRVLDDVELNIYENRKEKEFYVVIPCCARPECVKKNEKIQSGPHKGWICKRPRQKNERKEKSRKRQLHDEVENQMRKKQKL